MLKSAIKISALLTCAATLSAAAYADQIDVDRNITTSFASVDTARLGSLETCLNADVTTPTSKAIRACSKSYKNAVPSSGVRADILTQRGFLQLSKGRIDKASRDFDKAYRINEDADVAFLGRGFAALYENDIAMARDHFNNCSKDARIAPLAAYGLALVAIEAGEENKARLALQEASRLRPGWTAPQELLATL